MSKTKKATSDIKNLCILLRNHYTELTTEDIKIFNSIDFQNIFEVLENAAKCETLGKYEKF